MQSAALLLTLACLPGALFPAPQAGSSVRGSSSADFASLLATRDAAEVRRWFEQHPSMRFFRPAGLLDALIVARLNGNDAARKARQADASFLAVALDGAPPAGEIESVLAWDMAETAGFAELEREVESLSPPASLPFDLPDAERIERLRTASEELGAPGLLTSAWSPLARRLHDAGRAQEAAHLVDWIRTVAEAAGNPWAQAWCAEWQAQDAWRRGDLKQASAKLQIAEELDGILGDGAHRARMLCDLASVHLSLSDPTGGMEFAERAERIARSVQDGDSLRLALQTKAGLHLDLGEHQTALEICMGLIPAAPRDAARDLIQLHVYLTTANVLSDVGRLESALAFARRAHELAHSPDLEQAIPEVRSEVLLTLGLLLGDSGKTEEALSMLREARETFREAGDAVGVAWADKNCGWVLGASGATEEAVEAFQASQRTAARLGLPYLEGLTALGVAETLVADPDAAEAHFPLLLDALETTAQRAAELSDLQLAWRAATVRGRLLLQQEYPEGAFEQFEQAVELVERWRRRLRAPGLLAHALRNKTDPYREAAIVAARLGRHADVLRMTELLRARVLAESRARSHGPLEGSPPEPLRNARRRIAQAEHALRQSGIGSIDRVDLRESLATAEADLDGALLASELAARPGAGEAGRARSNSGSGSEHWRAPTPAALSKWIEASDVDQVVSFLPGPEGTLALVASADGVYSLLLEASQDDVSAWVARLRDPIEALRRGELDLTHLGFDHPAARALHDALFTPLMRAGFPPAERLVLIADDVLSTVPFELLVTGGAPLAMDPSRPFAHLRGLTYFAEDHRITYATSVAGLVSAAPGLERQGAWIAYAIVAPRELGVASADDELEALRRTLGTHLTIVPDACPEDLEHVAIQRADLLHLLAHGESDPVFPSQGHLLLGSRAPIQASPGADAPSMARLEAWQIEGLRLSARLTVLSACHSGEGAWYDGEGLFGLTRSFLAAGSRRVIASRWAVEDRASTRMMEALYRHLVEGQAPVDALQNARLELLRAEDPRGFSLAHPYFWAGWVVHQ